MAFWPIHSNGGVSTDSRRSAVAVGSVELPEPIAVFRLTGIAEGWIDPQGHRVSELLNSGQALRIQLADERGAPGPWTSCGVGDLVAVAPPPRAPDRARRVSRRRHRVALVAAQYRIVGTAHMPPGADPIRFVERTSQRWLPLTECSIIVWDDEYAVDVAIVNLAHVRAVEQLISVAS
jgi:hypothetical protein